MNYIILKLNRKLLIVFDHTIYVGYDNFSPTGHNRIRKMILEKFKTTKGLSFINVNELRLNSCDTEENRIEYLKKEGLDLREPRLII